MMWGPAGCYKNTFCRKRLGRWQWPSSVFDAGVRLFIARDDCRFSLPLGAAVRQLDGRFSLDA